MPKFSEESLTTPARVDLWSTGAFQVCPSCPQRPLAYNSGQPTTPNPLHRRRHPSTGKQSKNSLTVFHLSETTVQGRKRFHSQINDTL